MRVAVFEEQGKRKIRPAWKGCCMHEIAELDGSVAKVKAMQEHREKCMEPGMARP